MGSRHSKPSSPPKQLKPSQSKSKPKSSSKTKVSRPLSKTQLDYPSLPSPTFRRLTHTPKKTYPTPEEELRERVERYRYVTKKAPLPPVSRPPTRRAVVRPAPAPARVAAQRKESQYQFKPLNDIGRPSSERTTSNLPQQAVKVQLARQAVAKPFEIRPKAEKVSAATTKGKNSGYVLYPPKQKSDVRGGGSEYSFRSLTFSLLSINNPSPHKKQKQPKTKPPR